MPQWICPNCSASHNVTTQHIGRSGKCRKCGESSIISDSSSSDIAPDDAPDLLRNLISKEDAPSAPAVAAHQLSQIANPPPVQSSSPTSTAKTILTSLFTVMLLIAAQSLAMEQLAPLRFPLWSGVILFGIQITLVWPFYSACDDIRIIRERTPRR